MSKRHIEFHSGRATNSKRSIKGPPLTLLLNEILELLRSQMTAAIPSRLGSPHGANWPPSGRCRLFVFYFQQRLCYPGRVSSSPSSCQGLAGASTLWRSSNVSVYTTMAHAQRTDGPSRLEGVSRRPNKPLVTRLDCDLTLAAGWYWQKFYTVFFFLFFTNLDFFFSPLPEMFSVISCTEGQHILSASSLLPLQHNCTAHKCSSSVLVCVFDIVII